MKKFVIGLIIMIILTSHSCNVLDISLGPTSTPTMTSTPTPTSTPTLTPTPTNTPTPTLTPTPEDINIVFDEAGCQFRIPGSYSSSDFSFNTSGYHFVTSSGLKPIDDNANYFNGSVMITGENGDFAMVAINAQLADVTPEFYALILSHQFEIKHGLELDMGGLGSSNLSTYNITLLGMKGEGWEITGSMDGKPVEGEIVWLERDNQEYFITMAFMVTSDESNWENQGKDIFMDILKTLSFTQ